MQHCQLPCRFLFILLSEVISSSSLALEQDSPLRIQRSCWREGRDIQRCCRSTDPNKLALCYGSPSSEKSNITYDYCCKPPLPSFAANRFEDVNCERTAAAASWSQVRAEVKQLLKGECIRHGSIKDWQEKFKSLLPADVSDCPLGNLAVALARLALCFRASDQGVSGGDEMLQGKGHACTVFWKEAQKALAVAPLQPFRWLASQWDLAALLELIGPYARPDIAHSVCEEDGVDWPFLYAVTQSVQPEEGLPDEVVRKVVHKDMLSWPSCPEGVQWVMSILANICARWEVRCLLGYEMGLREFMEEAAESPHHLKQWVARSDTWKLFSWQHRHVKDAMRHDYSIGLSKLELEVLGVESSLASFGCAPEAMVREETHGSIWLVPDGSFRMVAPLECRALCGLDARWDEANPWAFFGTFWAQPFEVPPGQWMCWCVSESVVSLLQQQWDVDECTANRHIMLYPMPRALPTSALQKRALQLPGALPVLSQAASLLGELSAFSEQHAPAFVTMVFGVMARWIPQFAERVQALEIPNVVVFALDDTAAELCARANLQLDGAVRCMRGRGAPNALQKYIMVLAFVSLGKDVFWFDFDSVWLSNPLPALHKALQQHPSAQVLSAIDVDSQDCAMNAFFWMKGTQVAQAWILAVMNYIHRQPHLHDQLAFSLHLGAAPAFDNEPLPTPPDWGPLDPNIFVNAAKFEGLGFFGPLAEIVFFHFFDGWNSNLPSDAKDYMADGLRDVNFFETLYGKNVQAAYDLISQSRVDSPVQLRECRSMSSLGLGVITHTQTFQVPV